MAYVAEISKALTNTVSGFATLNAYQLAGQTANLDFWLDEVTHCLEVIDGYDHRFEKLQNAQTAYVAARKTVTFPPGELFDPAEPPTFDSPRPLRRGVKTIELKRLGTELQEATYCLLIRCYNDGLIDREALRRAAERVGIPVNERDLHS